MSYRDINNALKARGMAVAREPLLTLHRHAKAELALGKQLKFVRRDRIINPASLGTAITKQLRKYAYIIEVRGIDTSTGNAITRNITVSTDKLMTRADIEDEALSAAERGQYPGSESYQRAVLVHGRKAGGLGTIL